MADRSLQDLLAERARRLTALPGFDPDDHALLIDRDEWNRLSDELDGMRHLVSDEPPIPRYFKKIKILNIEVRIR